MEHTNHTEEVSSTVKEPRYNGRKRLAAGVTAAGLLVAGAGGAAAKFHSQDNQIKKLQATERQTQLLESTERAALNAQIRQEKQDIASGAQIEVLLAKSAAAQAEQYTRELQHSITNPSDAHSIPMDILNGTIVVKANDGSMIPEYKSPILLEEFDLDHAPDASGQFLTGGWIGIQGNDAEGKPVVTAVPFDPTAEKFVANEDGPVLMPVNVYASAVKGGPGFDLYELYAADPADPAGNTALINTDGTPMHPGLAVGMK